ncbi:MAG: hypothetical protein FJ100_21345 [Deltaproteobacteria bacterium]|nr:hypothetical protein [Deltaproteobacteria bacterium]
MGGCSAAPASGPCSDGNPCTLGDACDGKAAVCVSGPALNCDDNNPCTADACGKAGGCDHAPASGACDDGNACTAQDGCANGTCGGVVKACSDGNACTDDTCLADKGCVYTANAAPCSDGDACTLGDTCTATACAPGVSKVCDDENLCTANGCDKASGNCVFTDIGAKTCGDGNPCTDDACDKEVGCSQTANAAKCTDNNLCTSSDACKAGKCVPGPLFNCDDGEVCTDDSCDAKQGCVKVANQLACNDGSACTLIDVCQGGACVAGAPKPCDDKNPCTVEACNPVTGACEVTPTSQSCTDGNPCTQFDQCAGGKCVGALVLCDDGNVCTTDACTVDKGCQSVPTTEVCAADKCTTGKCSNGSCVLGPANDYAYFHKASGATTTEYRVAATAQDGTVYYVHTGNVSSLSRVPLGDLPQTVCTLPGYVTFMEMSGGKLLLGWQEAYVGDATALNNSCPKLQKVTFGSVRLYGATTWGGDPVFVGEQVVGPGNTTKPVIVRIDASLNVKWTSHSNYAAQLGQYNIFGAIAVDAGEQHAVAVGYRYQGLHYDALLATVDASGKLTEALLGGPHTDSLGDIAALPGGGFVAVGGWTPLGDTVRDLWWLRLDPKGAILWQRTLPSPGKEDGLVDVVRGDDGALVATGLGDTGAALIAIDPWFNVTWKRPFGLASTTFNSAIAMHSDGSVVGLGRNLSGDPAPFTFRRDQWGYPSCAAAGLCATIPRAACDDKDPCTTDTCEPTTGCVHKKLPSGSRCGLTAFCDASAKCVAQ